MVRDVVVSQTVRVTVDELKFTEEFMQEFRESFFDFYYLNDHLKHLAQLYARGAAQGLDDFIEGYGSAKGMGISFESVSQDEEVQVP